MGDGAENGTEKPGTLRDQPRPVLALWAAVVAERLGFDGTEASVYIGTCLRSASTAAFQ